MIIGEQQAEGESIAAASVTLADAFVPSVSSTPVLSPTDSAMESVGESLKRVSLIGDRLAQSEAIQADAIDHVLRGEL